MARVLSLSLRPRSLSGLYGQEALVKGIRAQMAARPPRAWLFHGGTGCGKTTLARVMAVAYQCSHMKLWGDPCESCWKEYTNPDGSLRGPSLHEINASESRGVEEMGRIAEISRYHPMGGTKRVIVLDEFQRATKEGQNLLLKPTEEPPATTIWFICTTDPQNILPTLRRRFTTYQLRSLGFEEREKFLERAAQKIKLSRELDPLYEAAHQAGVGSPAILLQALEKYAAGGTAAEAVASTDGTGANSLRICKAVTAGSWKELRGLLLAASPEDARWIRSSVSGWLRGILAKESDPKSQERAALSLGELTAFAPIEDAMMLFWLWSVLFKICKRYRGV